MYSVGTNTLMENNESMSSLLVAKNTGTNSWLWEPYSYKTKNIYFVICYYNGSCLSEWQNPVK